MMKCWGGILVLVVCFGLAACSKSSSEEMASLSAKDYYDHLIRGEFEYFLSGTDGSKYHNDDSYRQQLLDNYSQFMRQQQKVHQGIRETRVVRAKTDSMMACTNVFLMLCFGDSTSEEIVVPMVERQGRWLMK